MKYVVKVYSTIQDLMAETNGRTHQVLERPAAGMMILMPHTKRRATSDDPLYEIWEVEQVFYPLFDVGRSTSLNDEALRVLAHCTRA